MPQMVNMALVPEVQQVEERDSEYLESILDAAVLGATMALTGHKTPEEAIGALRVTAPLTLNGRMCKGLHLDTLSDYSYLIGPFLTKIFGSEKWNGEMLAEQPPTEVACGNHGTLRILGAVELQVRGDWGPALKHKFYVLPSFPANI